MTAPTLMLLPGLDGLGTLLETFARCLPTHTPLRVLTYPPREPLDYPGLERLLWPQLPAEGPLILVGESFGGPLAVRLGERLGSRLAGLILVASFIRNPVAPPLTWLNPFVPLVARFAPPGFAVRRYLLGPQAPDAHVRELQAAVASVSPATLAMRARAAVGVDVRSSLSACDAPVLYLQGDRDRLVPPGAWREVQQVRPDARLEVLPAPHLVLQARSAAAAEVVHAFSCEA